ncbi:MAG: iron-containing alcohol dehydrogenase [Deltaproteobacteria bacterium]|nr:iron-containing alcohol dehydrogenase [Deltaproteobacteria bacterium]
MPQPDPLALLLAGTYPDPETGEPLKASARAIAIEPTLAGTEADRVAALNIGRRFAVVADVNTQVALGDRVVRALAGQSIVLHDGVVADEETIARVAAAVEPSVEAIVAVGSGTINDICKMVALGRNCPQIVFATAPSMNGYTSVSASLTERGFKRSVRAITPTAAFFDLRVLAAAPPRLIRAGLGDSVARPTAQADWLLSHLLLDRPYREAPFAMLAGDETALLDGAAALLRGDLDAMRALTRTLVLSGFGMTLVGGSFPASQGEHLLSHYVELMAPSVPHTFHGEQIGVASLAMARLQDRILTLDAPRLHPTRITRDQVLAHFGPSQGETCWQELEQKLITPALADDINTRLAARWPQIRDRIARITLGEVRMAAALRAAAAPSTPEELGWPPALVDRASGHARMMRNRYTFLDFAGDLA